MQRSAYLTAALLTSAVLFNSACSDLGSCTDPARGRTTVVDTSGQLMFTGQAVINTTCISCHSSTAKGAVRRGAPAGLDFDLIPLTGTMTVTDSSGNIQGVTLDPALLAGLRTRQRKVFDEREMIWDQIEKGLMPPEGSSKSLMTLFKSMFGSDGKCTKGMALTTLDADKEQLRQWLACDVPIIEATSEKLPYKPLPAGASPADSAAGAAYYSIPGVSVGYQYPSCGGGTAPGGPTFEDVYNKVLAKTSNQCLICHGSVGTMGNFDIGTIDKAWTTLMGANGMGTGATTCAKHPVYVKPNDVDNSYLVNMLVPAKERCTPNVMPFDGLGKGLNADDLTIITNWINAGAPRSASSGGGADAGAGGGADAGNADAGVDAGPR